MTEENTSQALDLSPLKSMVGIRNQLTDMLQQGKHLSIEEILTIFETERESYAAHGGFRAKEQALGKIITALHDGEVQIDEILSALGLSAELLKESKGIVGFIKKLFRKQPPGKAA